MSFKHCYDIVTKIQLWKEKEIENSGFSRIIFALSKESCGELEKLEESSRKHNLKNHLIVCSI